MKEVIALDQGAVPDYLREQVEADAGMGVSTAASDNIVPLIYVLHNLSPQVDESNPGYVEGAKPGSIWLRNSPTPIIPGDEGVEFQPCFFTKDWVRWVPRERGGGFVGRFPNRLASATDVNELGADVKVGEDIPDAPGARFTIDQETRQKVWKIGDDDLILTRNHAGYVFLRDGRKMPFVIPMKGASHAVSRAWMFTMMSQTTPSGKPLPSFAKRYRLTTKKRVNKKGSWFQFETEDAGFVSAEEYTAGRELNLAFASGEKQADAESVYDTGAPVPEDGSSNPASTTSDADIPF